MNLTVTVDARDLQRALAIAPQKVNFHLNKWVYTTTLRTEREAKTLVPPNVDTGQLQSSINSRFGNLKGEVSPTSKHAIFVHEGRKPGRMPPFQEGTALNSWARRRGINPFVVARAIGRKGTKKNQFMHKAFASIKPKAEREAQTTLGNIVRSI